MFNLDYVTKEDVKNNLNCPEIPDHWYKKEVTAMIKQTQRKYS